MTNPTLALKVKTTGLKSDFSRISSLFIHYFKQKSAGIAKT